MSCRRRRSCEVEFAVQLEEALHGAGLMHRLGELGEPVDLRLGERGQAVPQQQRFDALAHLVELDAFVEAEPGDPRTGVGDRRDQPLGFQDPQRLSHRHAAGAVLIGQFFLSQSGAWRVDTVQDRGAQLVGDTGTRYAVTHLGLAHVSPPDDSDSTAAPRHRPRRPCLGEADQFELHAPRAQKVHPALTLAGVSARGRFSEYLDPFGVQILHRGIDVVHVEREVMPADIAVARWPRLPVGGLVLEHLEVGAGAAAVEPQFAHHRARMDVEMVFIQSSSCANGPSV